MKIAVSIIIPVYNTEKYLPQCLDSILHQTLQNMEIIIVDDASTDNSMEVIQGYKKKDPRIKVIKLPKNSPGGVSTPANRGMNKARGEYVGFVDSDDWVKPEMFETLYTLAKANETDYVFCDFFMADEEKMITYPSNDRFHWDNIGLLQHTLTKKNRSALLKLSSVPWRKLYKQSFLEKNNLRFPEGDFFYEDTPFHYMVTLKAEKVSYIDIPLYYHRISRPDQTMSGMGRKYFAFLNHGTLIYEYMNDEGYINDYINDFFLFIINNFFWVWDRLNALQREEFFHALHSLITRIDNKRVENFVKNADYSEAVRIKVIHNGNFNAYKFYMFKCKTWFGTLLRGFDYFRTHSPGQFLKKVIKKFSH